MISFHPHKSPIYYECVVIYDQDRSLCPSPARFPSVWARGHLISSSSQTGWGWVPAGPWLHLGPSPPQAVIPCRSASAALHPGTGSDTTGSNALTMAGCTSHHASLSPHSRPWWTIILVGPFPASESRLGCGVLGEQTVCPYLLYIQIDERVPPLSSCQSLCQETGWELCLHPMPTATDLPNEPVTHPPL